MQHITQRGCAVCLPGHRRQGDPGRLPRHPPHGGDGYQQVLPLQHRGHVVCLLGTIDLSAL